MRFYHYQLCSLPEDTVKYGSIGVFMKISHFLFRFVLFWLWGFKPQDPITEILLEKISLTFSHLNAKEWPFLLHGTPVSFISPFFWLYFLFHALLF